MKTTLYFTLTLLIFAVLAFVPNSFAQDDSSEYIVRAIYFIPNDRQPDPDMDTKLDSVIKDVQKFYADQMEAHGFERKTFRFETDDDGNAKVHHVNGKFNDTHYYNSPGKVSQEISQQFDTSKDFFLVAVDTGNIDWCGVASGRMAFMRSPSACVRVWVAAHELGHVFGLEHDIRREASHIMFHYEQLGVPYGLSECAAEWLDVHRAFNPGQPFIDEGPTTIEMLPPSYVSAPNTIRLRFEVSDPDGIHQAQLVTPGRVFSAFGRRVNLGGLIDCKRLKGNPNTTIEFTTNSLNTKTESVILKVIDQHGNMSFSPFYPDITSLLPSAEAVSVPDANLASAIRKDLGLAPSDTLTYDKIIDLIRLNANNLNNRPITDLTGLEYAINLKYLYLVQNQISDITVLGQLPNLTEVYLPKNQISDITPLLKLPNLIKLGLSNNPIDISSVTKLTRLQWFGMGSSQIQDLTPFAGFTNLSHLYLAGNQISDITPLAALTELDQLELFDNQISDITPLAALTELHRLEVRLNKISDITPLASLTKLRNLSLGWNQISDITPLAALTNLYVLQLAGNQISDVSPLAELQNLRELYLFDNQISDVSPLAELQNLRKLYLFDNPIENRKPLLELLRKNPDVKIYLKNDREPLPVTLSHFRVEHTDTGVVLKWTTESEVDNAGFYIYRSETKDGEFKVVNPKMIQGAGTTGERNEYTWTDTTAKPNTVYYYRIEDVSHAGVRQQLATVRLRGLVSAADKLTTMWADLKMQK